MNGEIRRRPRPYYLGFDSSRTCPLAELRQSMSEPTVAVHSRWRVPLLLLAFLTLFAAPAAKAQTRITGRVTAAGTGAPITAAQVQVIGTSIGTSTNADGRFTIT